MGSRWGLHPNAHVRTTVVVEVNKSGYARVSLANVLEAVFQNVHMLRLYGSIHSFCNGVVSRVVILCHAYADVIFLEFPDIKVAAILHTSVRMVYETGESVPARLCHSHAKRSQCINSLKRRGKAPSYYLTGIRIRDKVKVAASAVEVYIRYITDPQLVCSRGDKSPRQILPFVETMVGIRGGAPLRLLAHHGVLLEKLHERIASRHPRAAVYVAQH